jgi:hypothetical protein
VDGDRALRRPPWRERIEVGVALVDEGPNWIPIGGEEFFDSIELVVSLTEELGADWLAIFCYCGNSEQPVSSAEISTALKLDLDEVSRCIARMKDERLVKEVARSRTYALVDGRQVGNSRDGINLELRRSARAGRTNTP